jgi:hypothetical protein
MHDDRHSEHIGKRELREKRRLLCLSRRTAAGQIDANLADRDDVLVARQAIEHSRNRIAP